jgi:hypothetical protein
MSRCLRSNKSTLRGNLLVARELTGLLRQETFRQMLTEGTEVAKSSQLVQLQLVLLLNSLASLHTLSSKTNLTINNPPPLTSSHGSTFASSPSSNSKMITRVLEGDDDRHHVSDIVAVESYVRRLENNKKSKMFSHQRKIEKRGKKLLKSAYFGRELKEVYNRLQQLTVQLSKAIDKERFSEKGNTKLQGDVTRLHERVEELRQSISRLSTVHTSVPIENPFNN